MIFIICLIFTIFLSINIISASEVDTNQDYASQLNNDYNDISELNNDYADFNQLNENKNDVNAVDNEQADIIKADTSVKTDDTDKISANSDENTKELISNNENAKEVISNDEITSNSSNEITELTDNQSNTTIKDNETKIIVKSTYVVKERKLTLKLVDSKNQAIAKRKVSISIGDKTYTQTTDENGGVSLKISLDPGKYVVRVKFSGDSDYAEATKGFVMKVYKLKTKFVIPSKNVIRGKYFYAYLKDKNGNPLASKTVRIIFKNKSFVKKTNKNGRIQLKISSKVGKYNIKLIYKGSKTYVNVMKTIAIKIYNAKTKITFDSKYVKKDHYLYINLLYGTKKALANQKLRINFGNKNYKRTTNKNGKAYLKLIKPIGTYKIKVRFDGSKGFKKSSRSSKIKIIPNQRTIVYGSKNKTAHLDGNRNISYYIKFTDKNGNPIVGEELTLKVKCNNFTLGTGRKITKKTIVLSSDNIHTKKIDKKRLNDMAKLLRAKGYKVIVYGIGPNYHVNSVKKYKNVCVFSLVGGIDSGMYVDMSHSYYQYYLKKNNNQFVLGCVNTTYVNLANRIWLKRAHDDNYSPKKFKGLYFPGEYLNKKTHVDYVYGGSAKELVNNFLTYGRHGKSIGLNNVLPGKYKTYKFTTSKKGYVHIDLPIGKHTVICSFANDKYDIGKSTRWVNVIK